MTDGDSCINTECAGMPMWADGTPIMNHNDYMTDGITVTSGDTCVTVSGEGRIVGTSTVSVCTGKRAFLCMSMCSVRPKCANPPPAATSGGQTRFWDGKSPPDTGKVVRLRMVV